jgi:hypothetical protein
MGVPDCLTQFTLPFPPVGICPAGFGSKDVPASLADSGAGNTFRRCSWPAAEHPPTRVLQIWSLFSLKNILLLRKFIRLSIFIIPFVRTKSFVTISEADPFAHPTSVHHCLQAKFIQFPLRCRKMSPSNLEIISLTFVWGERLFLLFFLLLNCQLASREKLGPEGVSGRWASGRGWLEQRSGGKAEDKQ